MGQVKHNKKVALITGGSRGIGKGISIELAKLGYKVALTYNKNNNLAEKVVNKIIKTGGQAIAVQLSVEERDSIKQCIGSILKYYGNPISILINNAAISQEKHFQKITDLDWETMLKVNLQGPFMLTQELLSSMAKIGFGRIVNITSIGGQWGGFNQVHYAASKAALINFTQSIAKIYSKFNITSNAISIGLVKTDMSAQELASKKGKKKVSNIPIGRAGSIEEVAAVTKFLCSEEASYITGQTLNVNGGLYFG